VVLCPDVVAYIDSRFDCCDLLQRSVIHYGAERKASSAIISTPHSGRNDRNGMLRVYLAVLPKIELRPCLLCDSSRGFCIGLSFPKIISARSDDAIRATLAR
jgi:hypothetical protein